ncbi:unnamed protein product [Paramecium octaurelia]|uniref:Secreted protein n=1 Tax=Paramecium octaurelia TaxID=43137 RepID=A0A8S1SP71_PAROT|nr:unnamed protein product [Paramecium octaurelia]
MQSIFKLHFFSFVIIQCLSQFDQKVKFEKKLNSHVFKGTISKISEFHPHCLSLCFLHLDSAIDRALLMNGHGEQQFSLLLAFSKPRSG